jgi:hypothetical protein
MMSRLLLNVCGLWLLKSNKAAGFLLGAVAAITFDSGADRYAYRQGLFVLAQSGESMAILNDAVFEPRVW